MPEAILSIGFLGFCKTDIILYLSRVLHILGERVAIIDRSYEQEMRYSVPVGIYTVDRVDYRGVEVFLKCGSTALSDLPVTDFTVILIDFGVNHEAFSDMEKLKALFVITDVQRHHTIPLSVCLSRITSNPDSIRILRDTVSGKIRPRYIDSILQLEQTTNLIAAYEFPINEIEYAERLKSQYDDIFRFKKLPDGIKNMLLECITELFGKSRKDTLKALKKAMRGG